MSEEKIERDEELELEDQQDEQEDDELDESDEEESDDESDEEGAEDDDEAESVDPEEHRKVLERLAKAEKLIQKNKKASKKKKQASSKTQSTDEVDARVLKSQGMSDELIEKAQKVAQIEDCSLLDAVQTETFEIYKERYEADEKKRKASIGASRSSGKRKPQKDLKTPGLSEEEHKKLFDKANKR